MPIFVLFILLFITQNAVAYVGPGLGLGVVGVIIGVILAIILAVFGVVWYPIKRALKGKKTNSDEDDGAHDHKRPEHPKGKENNLDSES